MPHSIVALPADAIDAAGEVLAAAFADDPLQTYVFPDPGERRDRSAAQFATLVRHGHLVGDAVATPALDGVAVWLPPEPRPHPDPYGASGMTRLPQIMGADAHLRFGRVLDYLSQTHGAVAPPRAYYLMIVGVTPAKQRMGLGAALLGPMLARADDERVPCCLDTSQPANGPFYERLGFRVVIESVDPASGVRFWTYQRG